MRSDFFWTANRMITAWLVAMLVVTGGLVTLADAVGLSTAVLLVLAPVGGAVLIVPLLRILTRQVESVVAHASAERPDGVVVPGAALALSSDTGKALGLQTAGLNASGGSPVALVVLPNQVEVWSGRNESEPRWSVAVDDLTVAVGFVRVGMSNNWDVISLTDGATTVAVSPRYGGLPITAGRDIDRVLRELGYDPLSVRRAPPEHGRAE